MANITREKGDWKIFRREQSSRSREQSKKQNRAVSQEKKTK